ncbi:lipoyl(octanoyl) transferase LipB [Pseudonocardia spinosispora]|uniref:lipoyl(octanoyl) transferase LipB n=1 Tax=Pseudonocardia spinosispora TaxID=103441 RepID=UPI0004082053|nr:lipoyl(octanoyl) transferase LipB [Pseudonocardia spinosispora]
MAPVSCRAHAEPITELRLGLVDYRTAWHEQRTHAAARADGVGPDVLMLLEHPSVYTAGKRTREWEKPTDGTPVVDVDRGGKITWHGPGQLVGYPIVQLSNPIDVVEYVRRLEEGLIEACAHLGLTGARVDGRTGVWLAADDTRPERKVAAIGVRVQRGVTLHGFSLNCNPDMTEFDKIVPCGITDAGVTSLSSELGRTVRIDDVIDDVAACVRSALEGTLPVREHSLPAAPATPGLTLDLHPALR